MFSTDCGCVQEAWPSFDAGSAMRLNGRKCTYWPTDQLEWHSGSHREATAPDNSVQIDHIAPSMSTLQS